MIQSICRTVLEILILEYPNGLTRDELYQKARKRNPPNFFGEIMLDKALGTNGGLAMERETGIICWETIDDKIFYDPTKSTYSPTLRYGFSRQINLWLVAIGKRELAIGE
ncbi:MAG: hypothetical protein WC107_06625 [Patescibacteria group bacterium]